MHKYGFNILWSEEDSGYIALCPDFPGLSAFGETLEEALSEGQTALQLFIQVCEQTRDEIPEPTCLPRS